MRVSIIVLNEPNKGIAQIVADRYNAKIYVVKTSKERIGNIFFKIKNSSDIVIFITNVGIAVRAIAPYIESKWKDPGILVIDTEGKYVVSLLGGHWGLANKFTEDIAYLIGAHPVITTRSELLGRIPFDMVSRENNLVIENPHLTKYIASKFFEKRNIKLFSDLPIKFIPKNVSLSTLPEMIKKGWGVVISERNYSFLSRERFLLLRPKNISIGVGYRKFESPKRIKNAIDKALFILDVSPLSIASISTINHKAGDGILKEVGRMLDKSIRFIEKDDLLWIDKVFPGSSWVRESVGVGSVSLPSMIANYKGVKVLLESEKIDGIVISIGKIRKVIDFGK